MKRILVFLALFATTISLTAQENVVKFLGIPVDGTKEEMVRKLKEKGFSTSKYLENCLTGEFNGRESNVFIVTNRNKVWRIVVTDAVGTSEGQIKIRFNSLYRQFLNNSKYTPASYKDDSLSEDEDISYEMTVHNKQYQAVFNQLPDIGNNNVWFSISKIMGDYFISIYYDNLLNEANGDDL